LPKTPQGVRYNGNWVFPVMKSTVADRIAVIDVETTGLSPWHNDRIVEIAVVVVSPDGQIYTEYETLVNPNRDLGPSRIHGIYAADILRAPSFADVAGDVLQILGNASVIAGHNIRFDRNFLVKEYERIGIAIPETPLLCTYQLCGRMNLVGCCNELGITFDGHPHCALADARATARLVTLLCADDTTLLEKYHTKGVSWPKVIAQQTPCLSREQSQALLREPPQFLQRLANKIHHDIDAHTANVLAYLALIDRVLEDRTIDADEQDALVNAALEWKLTKTQILDAHKSYIHNLAVLALADGVIGDVERRDLHVVSRLLGQDDSDLDNVLQSAAAQLAAANTAAAQTRTANELSGKAVCFTGELLTTIRGQPITRDVAEALAEQAGLIVANNVTKKLDILVVADPNTQSGKAKKARDYGIRILSDTVFWRMIGITVD